MVDSRDSESESFERKVTIVLISCGAVGKTSLISRYMNDSFICDVSATTGIGFSTKTTYLEDRPIRIQIWDTNGNERFRSLLPSYLRKIRNSAAVVVVYDVRNTRSFEETTQLIDIVRAERGNDIPIMLVGNTIDLADKRKVSTEEGERKAKELNLMFMETSAKTGYNVEQMFTQVANAIFLKLESNQKNIFTGFLSACCLKY